LVSVFKILKKSTLRAKARIGEVNIIRM